MFAADLLGPHRNTPSPANFPDLDLGFLSSFVDDLTPVEAQPHLAEASLPQAVDTASFSQPIQLFDQGFPLPQQDLPGFPLTSFQPEFVQQSTQRNPQAHRPTLHAAAHHGRSSSRSSNESPPDEKSTAILDNLLQPDSKYDYLCDSLPGAELSGQDLPDDVEKARAKNRNAQKKFRARQKVCASGDNALIARPLHIMALQPVCSAACQLDCACVFVACAPSVLPPDCPQDQQAYAQSLP